MKLRRLTLADQPLVQRFLAQRPRELSAYSFPAIYIWRQLYDIRWQIIEGNLCIFFQDPVGQFVYTCPLGKDINPAALEACFAIMDAANAHPAVSRIENVAQEDASFFERLGYTVRRKADEYVCSRSQLARLAGDRFKSKRSCVNFFTKHYNASYEPFASPDRKECIVLFQRWMLQRTEVYRDAVYRGMLADSLRCLGVCLADYKKLRLTARVVRVDNIIQGFTLGFRLSADTFCVLFEVTDFACKGLSQFIFQRFCQELDGYAWVNIMDDAGLPNLRRVKLSYRPQRAVPGYIATKKQ